MKVGKLELQPGKRLFLICGPCVVESRDNVFRVAREVREALDGLPVDVVFKASYDKANRTSSKSFRGPGMDEGLKILSDARKEFGFPVLSDVHSEEQVGPAAEVLDVLQIPALLCRQTDLVQSAARTGKTVNIKKGQFLAPWDMKNVLDKALDTGNQNILLTERGVSFGYNTLVSDMRAIPIMKQWGAPVVFDGTHSVQQPGGMGTKSGGERQYVPVLTRAAVAAGADGLFLETHFDPDQALSDGPNMIPTSQLRVLLEQCVKIFEIVRVGRP